jgi:hypothetical protein
VSGTWLVVRVDCVRYFANCESGLFPVLGYLREWIVSGTLLTARVDCVRYLPG